MYILESELYSLCQIKSSLENERTVQMNRIQDEKFSYSLPRHSNTNIGEYVKGTLVLFLGILVVGGGYVQPEEMAKIVIYIIGGYILLSGIAILGGAVSEDLADSKRQQDMIEKEEVSAKHTKIDDKRVCVWMKKLTNDLDSILPLVRFQSAARTWRVKRGDFGTELKKKLDDRRCGYIGCLDSSMDVKSIQQWCIKQELMMSNKGTVREYEMFKNIVASFMKEINELDEIPSIYYSSQFEELVYKDDKTEIPISKLSAGYQSLLWMIMDLAYRVCLLNPELESREQVTGIVLIDEIDLHLHPKWQ